ncbi:hypothetical protein KI387_040986, partial [Taxus chinensis]
RRQGGHGGKKNDGDNAGRRTQEQLQNLNQLFHGAQTEQVLLWIDQAFCDAKAASSAPNPASSSHGDGYHLTPLQKAQSPYVDHFAANGDCNSGRTVGGVSPMQPLNHSSLVDLHLKLTMTGYPVTRVDANHVMNNNSNILTTFKDILQGMSLAQGMNPITPLTPAVTHSSVSFGDEV